MRRWFLIILVLLFGTVVWFKLLPQKKPAAKIVHIESRGLNYDILSDDPAVSQGMTIILRPAVNVRLIDGGREMATTTDAITVNDFLSQKKIPLAATDRIAPPLENFLAEGLRITIDRIVDLPETTIIEIPFGITRLAAPGMYYGREEVVVPGAAGRKEQNFLVTYKNGVEIKRKLLSERILEKPKTEQRQFGTLIEAEETATGRASWYDYKKCLCAAHPFYEKGRYVRVTSLASGKSIIVRINDRGPELDKHPDRVIDLDAVAYKELAGLGTGTILVKVELLRN